MNEAPAYPKRLIEVDLPIKRISAHARREKSIRHGHISTLHIWWARRPLAACRAVICASLWPDPADELCPKTFREKARSEMLAWTTHERQSLLSEESRKRFEKARTKPARFDDSKELQSALLDFIADFANWDNSTITPYLETSRVLTQAAHVGLGGAPGTHPLVVDPFAGGGSIPLEALRVGADAFASDINPVAVLLNKVLLEYIPKHGQRLADELRKWGEWTKLETEKELARFYPPDEDGATPIAYLWARKILCEGPSCGAEVPLLRSLWLAKKADRAIAIHLLPDRKAHTVDFRIITKRRDTWVDQEDASIKIDAPTFEGTVARGAATCPCCGFTTPVASIRVQLGEHHGGASNARMYCVVTEMAGVSGRRYRLPQPRDMAAFQLASTRLDELERESISGFSAIPDEIIATTEPRRVSIPAYGATRWRDLFNQRQLVALVTLCQVLRRSATLRQEGEPSGPKDLTSAVRLLLSLCLNRCADKMAAQVVWHTGREFVDHVFAKQAIPIVWEFAEANFFADIALTGAIEWICRVIEANAAASLRGGTIVRSSATKQHLPDASVNAVITDPPYYYSVPYSHLSDFFYVWLKRAVGDEFPELLGFECIPKDEECVQDLPHSEVASRQKDRAFYERTLASAFAESRRIARRDAIGIVVFAHTDTDAWESLIKAMIDAGWVVTGSWPIDTEMTTRLLAKRQSSLASSVHIVCRPRDDAGGASVLVGDWRDVLQELPRRIHEWMPRLADEGVVGADAIFACLGPALEVFSRYSRVEKASGEAIALKEYLEHVWGAVAKEAVNQIFRGADTAEFEEDARLTAMWLWTLSPGGSTDNIDVASSDDQMDEADDTGTAGTSAGFALEYDAARKIAQGLGAHLEALTSLVEVKGSSARLLAVAERTKALFANAEAALADQPRQRRKTRTGQQVLGFVADLEDAAVSQGWGDTGSPHKGNTVLDRVHQAMILFGAGRSEALKRFVVDDGAGGDNRFWTLAQALSALYPKNTDEKRWVDGVLARKKGLGF